MEYEADLCPGCGRSRTETTAPGMDGGYDASAVRCHGCAAVARESDRFSTPGADPRGIYISVHPRDQHRR